MAQEIEGLKTDFCLKLEDVAGSDQARVLEQLSSDVRGLSWEEAKRRLSICGINEIRARRPPPWPVVLWEAFRHPFNVILAILATVSYATGDIKATVVMSCMIVLSAGLRFWQEMKSRIQAESLKKLVRNEVTVLRIGTCETVRKPSVLDDAASEISTLDLVPGDIVLLSAGDMVPADLRVIESRDLFVTQSALTGEAMPVEKFEPARHLKPGQSEKAETLPAEVLDTPHLLLMGSSIVSGTGKAIVVATGSETYFGAMAEKITGKRPLTAFDKGVKRVSWVLINFMLVMTPIVFLINGLVKGDWLDAFLFSISIAVGLTPEMLPMIVNANLARGAIAMARKKAIVKHLHAIQNFGAMDVLCTDKTGTLTQDKVVLIRHVNMWGADSNRVLEHAYLNSLFQTGLRNLLDRAVIDRANELELRDIAKSWWRYDELPFDFTRRRMSVILRNGDGELALYCKGAVEEMLDICTKVEDGGKVEQLSLHFREQLLELRDRLNEDGLRVIAVGYRKLPKDHEQITVQEENNLIFSGFIAFLDPPKESTAEALKLLKEHGVTVKILTGDNAVVARKICRQVDLNVNRIMTGGEISQLSDEQLAKAVEETTIFAKLNPMQKARVVKILKANSHTVGFMGDGINDATALREADVGISVDSAVDVAKEAADIILLEKSLLVLEQGIIEGRRTFGNVIKYIKMTASSNFGNVFSVLVASAFLPFLPMFAVQLLLQNLLYDISQIAIPWDRMDPEYIKRPRQWASGTVALFMIFIGPISSIFDIATFWFMWNIVGANTVASQGLFQSGWFVEGLLTQTLIVHMIRTEKVPFIQSTAAPVVLLTTTLVMAFGIWIPFSPFASAFRFEPLPLIYFMFIPFVLFSYCVLTQLVKVVYIRKLKSWL